jgi:MoxR-like ATPase
MASAKTVILCGPQGSGKTMMAQQTAAKYGCAQVVDGWDEKQPLTPGAMHITNVVPRSWPADVLVLGNLSTGAG